MNNERDRERDRDNGIPTKSMFIIHQNYSVVMDKGSARSLASSYRIFRLQSIWSWRFKLIQGQYICPHYVSSKLKLDSALQHYLRNPCIASCQRSLRWNSSAFCGCYLLIFAFFTEHMIYCLFSLSYFECIKRNCLSLFLASFINFYSFHIFW